VIVGHDDGRGVEFQCPLGDFAHVDFQAIQGSGEQVFHRDDLVSRVEEGNGKHLALVAGQTVAEHRACSGRIGELGSIAPDPRAHEGFGLLDEVALLGGKRLGDSHCCFLWRAGLACAGPPPGPPGRAAP